MGLSEQTKGRATAPALFNLPLIGRATELSMLGQSLTNTAAGRGCTVILAGEGGWTDDPAEIAPWLTEWRNRWTGHTPLMARAPP